MKRSTLGLAVLVVLGCSEHTQATTWQVTQLTDNDYEDYDARVSGSNVVWSGYVGDNWELFFYDGTSTRQLTDTAYHFENRRAEISGSNVVWVRTSDLLLSRELCLWDGSEIRELASRPRDKGPNFDAPQVSGSNVVFQATPAHHYDDGNFEEIIEIFLYDGSTTIQLTDNDYYDDNAHISGSNVVWQGYDGNDREIFLYDGVTTTQLTDNDDHDQWVDVSGSNVVWCGRDADEWDAFLYDGSRTKQLPNHLHGASNTRVSGSNVVWLAHDGNDHEILFYDGVTTIQLSDNDYDDTAPQVFGQYAVWVGNTGNSTDGHGREIFLWDGSRALRLTNNDYADVAPRICGTTVVWFGYDGNDYEIFQATIIPEPSTLALLGMGAMALLACAWRRKRETVREGSGRITLLTKGVGKDNLPVPELERAPPNGSTSLPACQKAGLSGGFMVKGV